MKRFFFLLCVTLFPSSAFADATVFIGVASNPSNRTMRGFSAGVSLLIVGFEFEYASVVEKQEDAAPSLRTGSGNVFVQTPPLGAVQLYATTGAGFYRERLGTIQETNVAVNSGGGAKIELAGPLRVRVDYRLVRLRGSPLHKQTQRVYVGLNLAF